MDRNIHALGHRLRFGVIGPSTNTIVEPEFEAMRPRGVTNHYSRILNSNAGAVSDETFFAGTAEIEKLTYDAAGWVLNAEPDHLVMGMSAVTFEGGADGADAFERKVRQAGGGRSVSIGSHACREALRRYGGISSVAILSPYWPAMNAKVTRYFEEVGFEVRADRCLRCRSWTEIAKVGDEELIATLKDLSTAGAEAIIQVGTNLSMARLAGEAERWLGLPMIAINTATYWHALRQNGIADQMDGFGRLLSEF